MQAGRRCFDPGIAFGARCEVLDGTLEYQLLARLATSLGAPFKQAHPPVVLTVLLVHHIERCCQLAQGIRSACGIRRQKRFQSAVGNVLDNCHIRRVAVPAVVDQEYFWSPDAKAVKSPLSGQEGDQTRGGSERVGGIDGFRRRPEVL
jgi:hypothetical protein